MPELLKGVRRYAVGILTDHEDKSNVGGDWKSKE
jgi:hypothetical protein